MRDLWEIRETKTGRGTGRDMRDKNNAEERWETDAINHISVVLYSCPTVFFRSEQDLLHDRFFSCNQSTPGYRKKAAFFFCPF